MKKTPVTYETLIADAEHRIAETERRIAGCGLASGFLLCVTLYAASSPKWAPAWPIVAAGLFAFALPFLAEVARLPTLLRDLRIIQSDRLRKAPPNRADLECERAVHAALAEGDESQALAEAA